VVNALFFLKFTESRPAFISVYDIIGVVGFLLTCLALFIILPFSNFIEWSKSQKQSFKRLIIMPLILFLLIFSLKFLLPGNVYRKVFFKEYSEAKKIYFDMKDYEIDFTKK
jgi:H+/Cl- antiporter ClcA